MPESLHVRVSNQIALVDSLRRQTRDARNDLAEISKPLLLWAAKLALETGLHQAVCPGKHPAFLRLVADWTWPANGAQRPREEFWICFEDLGQETLGKVCLESVPIPEGVSEAEFEALLEVVTPLDAYLEQVEAVTGLTLDAFRALAEAHLNHPDNFGQAACVAYLDIPPGGN